MGIQRIRKINEDILLLAKGAQQSAINHKKVTSKQELSAIQAYYRMVRDGAQSMCNSLRKGILTPHGCGNQNHDISLCLEVRDYEKASPEPGAHRVSTLSFKMVFSITEANPDDNSRPPVCTRSWKELQVEPINAKCENSEENKQEDNGDQGSASTSPLIIITNDGPRGESPLLFSPKIIDNHASPVQPSRPTTPTNPKRVSFSS